MLKKILTSTLALLCMSQSSLAVTDAPTTDELSSAKALCYELLAGEAQERLAHNVPFLTYAEVSQQSEEIADNYILYLTLGENLFTNEIINYGTEYFDADQLDRRHALNKKNGLPGQLKNDISHEFRLAFITSHDPDTDREYLEYCSLTQITPAEDTPKAEKLSQMNIGSVQQTIANDATDLYRDGVFHKITSLKKDIHLAGTAEIWGELQKIIVAPYNAENDFLNFAEHINLLISSENSAKKTLANRISEALSTDSLQTISESPEIKWNPQSRLLLIEGIPSNHSLNRIVRGNFWDILAFKNKNVMQYLLAEVTPDIASDPEAYRAALLSKLLFLNGASLDSEIPPTDISEVRITDVKPFYLHERIQKNLLHRQSQILNEAETTPDCPVDAALYEQLLTELNTEYGMPSTTLTADQESEYLEKYLALSRPHLRTVWHCRWSPERIPEEAASLRTAYGAEERSDNQQFVLYILGSSAILILILISIYISQRKHES